MCEDPEQRLYKKRLDASPTMSSTVSSEDAIENSGVTFQTDAQSQLGMQHSIPVNYLGIPAYVRKI